MQNRLSTNLGALATLYVGLHRKSTCVGTVLYGVVCVYHKVLREGLIQSI